MENKRRRWTAEETELLYKVYPTTNNFELAEIFGRKRKRIIEKALKLGLHKIDYIPMKPWTSEEEQLLSTLYSNAPRGDLEHVFNRPVSVIKTKANRLGFLRDKECISEEIRKALTKKIINQDYFDIIDTEAKAYFLGLLWADGGVPRHGKNVMLKLIERDKHILDSFQDELRSTYKLTCRVENLVQNTYTLCISSKQLVNDLAKYNVVPNKTYLDLDLPELPESLVRHFFRGVFDGDGCISGKVSDKGLFSGNASIAARSLKTCEWALHITKEHLGVGGGVYAKKNSNTNYWVLSGKHQLAKLAQWLYKDATFYLSRKHNKFVEVGLI